MKKYKVGVIGATGYVGQRFLTLLDNHPWFDVKIIAASPRSAGKRYSETMKDRWKIDEPMPEFVKDMTVMDASKIEEYTPEVDFVFCAVDLDKESIVKLEEAIAKTETPVISNNSANRWTKDVPMIIPEINPHHAELIHSQRKRLGTKVGFISVKPNCSIQSYVPALAPLMEYGVRQVNVTTYQAISGAGKNFQDWPEMIENVIPYIGGEEEKSEKEPLKIFADIKEGNLVLPDNLTISAQCYRVAVREGHLAAVSVKFDNKPEKEEILKKWDEYKGIPQEKNLPNAPKKFLKYFNEDNRPQSKLDADFEKGMGITIGRLREDNIFDYKFACLSHNTIRGAAGGAVLTAELLVDMGYIPYKD